MTVLLDTNIIIHHERIQPIELGVIKDITSAPRGFERLTDEQFSVIMKETGTNENIIVD